MWGVAAALKDQTFDARERRLEARDLIERSIFVIGPLDEERRSFDPRQATLDVPAAKSVIKPNVVPTPEDMIGIVVVTPESRGEIRRFIGVLRLPDALECPWLDEDVGRLQNEARDQVRELRCGDQGDGRAVAMAEKMGSRDPELIEDCRQQVRFAMHVVRVPRRRQQSGTSMTTARPGDHFET